MDLHGYGDLTGSDDNERKKVASLRSLVERQDPAAKDIDNLMLRRFLHARDLDVEKASTMFLKYLRWRREAVPNGFISEAEIQNELIQKKICMQGFDKMGCPIIVAFGARHYYSKRDMDEFKRCLVVRRSSLALLIFKGGDIQTVTFGHILRLLISCRKFAGIANDGVDFIQTMQNNYPERLGKVLLIHVPYIFMKAWKMIYPFIDKNTKKKFIFVEDKNLNATLLEDIDESQLPEIYGGRLPLVPIGDSAN